MSLKCFGFAMLLAVCWAATIQDDGGCKEGAAVISLSHLPHQPDAKLTPDYVAGPWIRMDQEQDFAAWTNRPKIKEALTQLANASATIQQIDSMMAEAKQARSKKEQEIISMSNSTITELETDIARIVETTRAYEKIRPTQGRIKFEIGDVLTPLLKEVSGLFSVDAQVRFPFAERLAVFTEDLQKTLRAKEDAECKLRAYLPPDELHVTLAKYDEIAEKVKSKIDSEVKAAGGILNPNSKHLKDVSTKILESEQKIQELRNELKEAMAGGQNFIPHEETVKRAILENQQALMDSVVKASQIEAKLEADLKAIHEKEDEVMYHIGSLLTALLQPNDVPAQSALQKPMAVQTVAHPEA